MNPTEVHQLLEKCKAATHEAEQWNTESPASKEWKANKINNAAFIRSANPQAIQTLAEDYLAALEHIKNIQGWLLRMEELNWNDKNYAPKFKKSAKDIDDFLKQVGIDASEGNEK